MALEFTGVLPIVEFPYGAALAGTEECGFQVLEMIRLTLRPAY